MSTKRGPQCLHLPMSWARHSSDPITFLDPYFVVAFYKWGGGVSYRGGVGWCHEGGGIGWVIKGGVGWGGWVIKGWSGVGGS